MSVAQYGYTPPLSKRHFFFLVFISRAGMNRLGLVISSINQWEWRKLMK